MKKFLMFIPGFRSKVIWKMALSSVYYVFSALMLFSGLSVSLFFLSLPFLLFYFFNLISYKKKGITLSMALSPFILSLTAIIISMAIAPASQQNKITNQNPSNKSGKSDIVVERHSPIPNAAKATSERKTALDATPSQKPPVSLQKVMVSRFVDGDTIYIKYENGEEKKLRFIGVDTPETKDPRKEVEYYGKEASDYTHSRLNNKSVYLEKDVSDTDQYNRLLRYVWLEPPTSMSESEIKSKMFNSILVLNGYAHASTYPPDVKYSKYFAQFQEEARTAGKGFWGTSLQSPTKAPEVTPSKAPQSSIKQVAIADTVRRGQYASIKIQGKAGVTYNIIVTYKSGPSTAEGLVSKAAGNDGIVSWTWKVGSKTTPGMYPITISGDGNTLTTYFTVTK
ncbi:MAG: thermonuclease family protein [Bacillota bacterium]|nr:thermonuclease family protein [Bacillota bacterium]